ncbi:hypothetical protein JOE46_001729 [Rhodococcus sp. PvR099]|nr:hypothetical protein [Rhodococcus sp. PvR099]
MGDQLITILLLGSFLGAALTIRHLNHGGPTPADVNPVPR